MPKKNLRRILHTSISTDFHSLRNWKINLDVYASPEKYLIVVPIEKIIADSKFYPNIVDHYKQRIREKGYVLPVIVIKHSKDDLYVVVDGHHRYYANVQLGKKLLDCALLGIFPDSIFYLATHGFFQAKPVKSGHRKIMFRFTRHLFKLFLKQDIKTLPFTEEEINTTRKDKPRISLKK